MKTVLVTGAAGYIGSTIVRHLLHRGHTVWGLDLLLYGDSGAREFTPNPHYKLFKGDIRDPATYETLLGQVDAVIHLAAIVGMPVCSKYPDLANEVNWLSTKALFDCASRTGTVKRFLFASSTSVYGAGQDHGFVNEESPTNPLSLYAELKLKCEDYMRHASARSGFVPTVLRFPTAYGLSGRMRFDLTVNEFTRDLALGAEVKIFGEGCWRPYCHVDDLAQACVRVLEASEVLVDHEVYCVGDTNENYTKQMLCEILREIIPGGKMTHVQHGDDPRDYRVDCSKIQRIGFCVTKTVRDGVQEIFRALRQGLIPNPYDPMYTSTVIPGPSNPSACAWMSNVTP